MAVSATAGGALEENRSEAVAAPEPEGLQHGRTLVSLQLRQGFAIRDCKL